MTDDGDLESKPAMRRVYAGPTLFETNPGVVDGGTLLWRDRIRALEIVDLCLPSRLSAGILMSHCVYSSSLFVLTHCGGQCVVDDTTVEPTFWL